METIQKMLCSDECMEVANRYLVGLRQYACYVSARITGKGEDYTYAICEGSDALALAYGIKVFFEKKGYKVEIEATAPELEEVVTTMCERVKRKKLSAETMVAELQRWFGN